MLNISLKQLNTAIGQLETNQQTIVEYINARNENNYDTVFATDIADLKSKAQALETKAGELEGTLDAHITAATTMRDEVNTLNINYEGVSGDITDLKSRVFDLEAKDTEVDTLLQGYSDLVSTVGGLSSSMSTAQSDIGTINTTLSELSTTVSTNKTAIEEALAQEVQSLTALINAQSEALQAHLADAPTTEGFNEFQEQINSTVSTVTSKIDNLTAILTSEVEEVESFTDVPIATAAPEYTLDENVIITDVSEIQSQGVLSIKNNAAGVMFTRGDAQQWSIEESDGKIAITDQVNKKVNMLIGETVELNKMKLNGVDVKGVDNLLNTASSHERIPTSAAVVEYVSKIVAVKGICTDECCGERSVKLEEGMEVKDEPVKERSMVEPVVDYKRIEEKVEKQIEERIEKKVEEKVQKVMGVGTRDAKLVIEAVNDRIALKGPADAIMINDNTIAISEMGPVFITENTKYAIAQDEGLLCVLEGASTGVVNRFVEYSGTIYTINTGDKVLNVPGVVLTQKLSSACAGVVNAIIKGSYNRNGISYVLPESDKAYVSIVRSGFLKISNEINGESEDGIALGDLLIPGANGIPTISSAHDAAVKFAIRSRSPLMKIISDTADGMLLVEIV